MFASFAMRGAVASLFDFENRGSRFFPGVHASYKFCLISLAGKALREPVARYAFYLLDTSELENPNQTFELSPQEITLINPNTRTLPTFRNPRDAALTKAIYGHVQVLWDDRKRDGNPWGITFKHLFNMTDDSDLFRTDIRLEREGWHPAGNVFVRDGKRMLPLYEAKMVHHFDHRWASFRGTDSDDPRRLRLIEKQDPSSQAEPRYWVAEEGPILTSRKGREVKLPGASDLLMESKWGNGWLCGWRDVCRATDERTAIPALIPRAAVGNKFHLMLPNVSEPLAAALVATQSSLVFDFVSRQKIGSIAMGLFIWKQLPVPTPTMLEPHLAFIVPRVLELVYTAYDMTPLARDLGDEGEPFRWDEDRRAQLRAELDAFFFHLYGIDDRDDVDYILETFQTRDRRPEAQRDQRPRRVPHQAPGPSRVRPHGRRRHRGNPVHVTAHAAARPRSASPGTGRPAPRGLMAGWVDERESTLSSTGSSIRLANRPSSRALRNRIYQPAFYRTASVIQIGVEQSLASGVRVAGVDGLACDS